MPSSSHLDRALPAGLPNESPANIIHSRVAEHDTGLEQVPDRMPFPVVIKLHVPSPELTDTSAIQGLRNDIPITSHCQESN